VHDPLSLGFNGTLSDLALTSLDFGQSNGFEVDYAEPAKGAGDFTIALHKMDAAVTGKFSIVSITNKSAHAVGDLVMSIKATDVNLTLALDKGKTVLPGDAKVGSCNFVFGHNITAVAINPDKSSTVDADAMLQLVVNSLFGSWGALTKSVNQLLAPDICDKFLKKYIEGNTSSLTSVIHAVNTKVEPLLVPAKAVVVPASVSAGMVNWPESFKEIKWLPLFLLEEALTFAAPMLNKFITKELDTLHFLYNNTISLNSIFTLIHVVDKSFKNPFPITINLTKIPVVKQLNISITDVNISGLTDFNYLALMVPLKNQTLMNSFGMGSFGAILSGYMTVPSIVGKGLTIKKDLKVGVKMPNAVLNLGTNVFVKSGYFQKITVGELLKPLCLVGGWENTTDVQKYALDSFSLESDEVTVDVKTSGDIGLLDSYVDKALQFAIDAYRDALPAVVNHLGGPGSNGTKTIFDTLNGLVGSLYTIAKKKGLAACTAAKSGKGLSVVPGFALPGPGPNKTTPGNETYFYNFTLKDFTVHDFVLGNLVCNKASSTGSDARDDASPLRGAMLGNTDGADDSFTISLGGFDAKVGIGYHVVNLNQTDSKGQHLHADGTSEIAITGLNVSATLTFKDGRFKSPTVDSAIAMTKVDGTFTDATGNTFDAADWLNMLVVSICQGWEGVPAFVEYLVPPLLNKELQPILQKLHGTSDLALYNALSQRCK
jgi:hypothetical protein